MPIIVLLVGLSTILTIYIGGQRVIAGKSGSRAHLPICLLRQPADLALCASVGWVTSLVQKAEASMERINDFMEAEPLIQSQRPPTQRPQLHWNRWCLTTSATGILETGIEALQGVSFGPARSGRGHHRTYRQRQSTIMAMRIVDLRSDRLNSTGSR